MGKNAEQFCGGVYESNCHGIEMIKSPHTVKMCFTCRFWAANDLTRREFASLIECRRHAPKLGRDENIFNPAWPMTSGRDWCGDWEQFKSAGPGA